VSRWLIALGLAVALGGCRTAGPEGASGAGLADTSWVAEDIDGRGLLAGVQSTLVFDDTQRISGRAACNQYFGTVERGEGARLLLKPAGSTRMACPDPVMDQERRFLEALTTITTYRRDGTALLLLDSAGTVKLRLAPLSPR